MKHKRIVINLMSLILSFATTELQTKVSERPIRVMSVGDSITEGNPSANYRENLLTLVTRGGKTIDFVGHNVKKFPEDGEQSGEGGWRADQIAGVASPPIYESSNIGNVQTWIPTFQPDIILLMAGKNDILQGRGTAGTTANLEMLIKKAFEAKPNVSIVVGLITPSRNNADFPESHIAINNNIKSMIATLNAEGKDITWVDTYSAMNGGDSTLYKDSVHPNQTGYDRIAESFYDGLSAYLNSAPYTQQRGEVIGGGIKDASKPFVNAFDGNTSTSASLKRSGWVGLDLGEARQIYNIRVRHGSNYTRKLLIQGSNSRNFSSGVSRLVSIPKADKNRWTGRSILDTKMYRYVRVKPNDGNGVGIREFEIFSVDESKNAAPDLNLQPFRDAYVHGGVFTNQNDGTSSGLLTKKSLSNEDRKSYFQFDLARVIQQRR